MVNFKFLYSFVCWGKKNYFPVFLVIAFCVVMIQKTDGDLPSWINNHLNDLLCMPIVLFITQFGVRKLKKQNNSKLPVSFIVFSIVLYSVFFEFYLPKLKPRYTADFVDVLMYCFGGLYFYLVEYQVKYKTKSIHK